MQEYICKISDLQFYNTLAGRLVYVVFDLSSLFEKYSDVSTWKPLLGFVLEVEENDTLILRFAN